MLLIGGGVLVVASISSARNAPGIRSINFRNFTYAVDGTNLVLHDGKYHEGDSASRRSYTLLPVKYVDFNRDGNEEAFVVLDYRTSGTYDHGQEYFVFTCRRGIAQAIFHESREKPFDVRVSNRRIVIASPFWKDGGLCCPSGIETSAYVFRGGRFVRASRHRRYMAGDDWWLQRQRASNKSLDASGGSVFRIIVGSAMRL
jgi:hypothetical protein